LSLSRKPSFARLFYLIVYEVWIISFDLFMQLVTAFTLKCFSQSQSLLEDC